LIAVITGPRESTIIVGDRLDSNGAHQGATILRVGILLFILEFLEIRTVCTVECGERGGSREIGVGGVDIVIIAMVVVGGRNRREGERVREGFKGWMEGMWVH
jgi:hypothetical protein